MHERNTHRKQKNHQNTALYSVPGQIWYQPNYSELPRILIFCIQDLKNNWVMVGLFLMLKKSIKSEQEWRSYGLFWLFSAKKGWKINLLKKPIKRGRRARNANRKNGLAFYPTPWEPWKVPGPPQLWARWSNPFNCQMKTPLDSFEIIWSHLSHEVTKLAIL